MSGQPADRPAAAELVRADLMCAAAVEDFVRAACPAAGPPQVYHKLIDNLGAECFTCREIAGRRLREACSGGDLRWLFWGRRSADAEIRLRSNNLLRDLTRCPDCGGGGICRMFRNDRGHAEGECTNCGQWAWSHGDYPRECRACGGDGFAWNKGALE
jgi:hypothetical protein